MTPKKLRTLDEVNAEVTERKRRLAETLSNNALSGIACPDCGAELREDRSPILMGSNPPGLLVWCEACPYKGSRLR